MIKKKFIIFKNMIKILIEFLKLSKKYMILLILCSLMKGLTPVLYTFVISKIAIYIIDKNFEMLFINLIFLFIIQLIRQFSNEIILPLVEKMKYKLQIPIKEKFINQLCKIDYETREEPEFARKISRANSAIDPSRITYLITDTLDSISYIISIVLYLFALLNISIYVVLFNVLILVITSIIMSKAQRYYSNYSRNNFDYKRLESTYKGHLLSSNHISQLKIFKSFEWMKEKWKKQNESVLNIDIKGLKKKDKLYFLGMFLSGSFLMIVSLCIYLLLHEATTNNIINIIQISGQTAFLINRLSIIIGSRELDLQYFEDYFDVFKENNNLIYRNNNIECPEIELKNVNFSYNNSDFSLKNINLVIPKGKTIAIVGVNGSGKTTLLNLILGIYNSYSGQILFNGQEINNVKKGMIFQNFNKYQLKVIDNVGYGDICELDNISKINNALSLANLNLFFDGNIYMKLGTLFGGKNLSGGEWQRLVLARTYFRSNCGLIVWDEPNSSLDPIEEFEFLTKMVEYSKEKTSIFVTHRLAAVTMVDKIIVLDDGKIIEEGNHQCLMEQKGKYYQMFISQANNYKTGQDR